MNKSDFIRDYENTTRRYERMFFPKVKAAIHVQYTEAMNVLKAQGVQAAISHLNQQISNPALTEVVRDLYKTVGLAFARKNYSRLLRETGGQKSAWMKMQTKAFGFNDEWTAFILDYLQRYMLEKITFEVAENTRNWVLNIIQQSVAEGASYDQIVDRLGLWPGEEYRSARIVRTEVNRAANVGAKAMSSTASFRMNKEWISAKDRRVRGTKPEQHANHVALNGTVIDEAEYFIDPRNGDRLEFPGDVNASGKSTINCRCAVAYTAKRDERGNLIPKRRSTVVIMPGQIRRPQTVTI